MKRSVFFTTFMILALVACSFFLNGINSAEETRGLSDAELNSVYGGWQYCGFYCAPWAPQGCKNNDNDKDCIEWNTECAGKKYRTSCAQSQARCQGPGLPEEICWDTSMTCIGYYIEYTCYLYCEPSDPPDPSTPCWCARLGQGTQKPCSVYMKSWCQDTIPDD